MSNQLTAKHGASPPSAPAYSHFAIERLNDEVGLVACIILMEPSRLGDVLW